MIAEIEAARRTVTPSAASSRWSPRVCPSAWAPHISGETRLDARLAGALMGIQAIKGVEVGDGFETARRRGSAAHDEMVPGPDGVERSTNRAGGLEGGMTNGQALRVRAAMKPISTGAARSQPPSTWRPADGERHPPALRRVRRASACGVVAEAMVALVVAQAVLEKFGGDSMPRRRGTSAAYLRDRGPSAAPMIDAATGDRGPQLILTGFMGRGVDNRPSRCGSGSVLRSSTPTPRSSGRPDAPSPRSSPRMASPRSASSNGNSPASSGGIPTGSLLGRWIGDGRGNP